jgi:hypothetical protein
VVSLNFRENWLLRLNDFRHSLRLAVCTDSGVGRRLVSWHVGQESVLGVSGFRASTRHDGWFVVNR